LPEVGKTSDSAIQPFRFSGRTAAARHGLRWPWLLDGPAIIIIRRAHTALGRHTQIEVLARIKEFGAAVSRLRRSIYRRFSPGRPDGDGHGAAPYESGGGGRPPREMLSHPQQPYDESLWAVSSLRKEESRARPDPARRCGSAATAQLKVLHGRQTSGARAAGPSRWLRRTGSGNPWRASYPVVEDHVAGSIVFDESRWRAAQGVGARSC